MQLARKNNVTKCISYIIIIPPQKKRKKQRSPQMFHTVALTWDVGQWEKECYSNVERNTQG
jgi:hypothetical protein